MKLKLKRVSKEHQYWTEKIQEVIKGYKDEDIERQLVHYVKEIDFESLSEEEKDLF